MPLSENVVQGDDLIVSGILNAKINKACRRSFSREAVKILRKWLQDHAEHPYPNAKEKEVLQMRTGLRKDQVSNWLANARRRGKAQRSYPLTPHVTSPSSHNSPKNMSPTLPMQVPGREPMSYQISNPLDRYVPGALDNAYKVSLANVDSPAKLAVVSAGARSCISISYIKCYRRFIITY